MRKPVALCLLLACATLAAQIPPPTDLPSKPFFIRNTWIVGGHGNWDYLAMDPAANRLYIAHGAEVQVVDVETGQLAGSVKGLHDAHSIALDSQGQFGYVSDGAAGEVKVFDRSTFDVLASIHTAPAPRAIALDPATGLLVAICASGDISQETSANPSHPRAPNSVANHGPTSIITVIDTQTRAEIAEILVPGRLNFAESDHGGRIYIGVEDRNAVARLDLGAVAPHLHPSSSPASSPASASAHLQAAIALDWTDPAHPPEGGIHIHFDSLGPDCSRPRALALDAKDERVFVACSNLKMAVLDTTRGGGVVTTLPIGPNPDAVGFDADRGLIFSANGGAQGSLTVIRRDVTDTYAVVQILPTRQQARTLAVNRSTGQVYLVTVINVAQLGSPPRNGIGTLKLTPDDASFQVLVVGN